MKKRGAIKGKPLYAFPPSGILPLLLKGGKSKTLIPKYCLGGTGHKGNMSSFKRGDLWHVRGKIIGGEGT